MVKAKINIGKMTYIIKTSNLKKLITEINKIAEKEDCEELYPDTHERAGEYSAKFIKKFVFWNCPPRALVEEHHGECESYRGYKCDFLTKDEIFVLIDDSADLGMVDIETKYVQDAYSHIVEPWERDFPKDGKWRRVDIYVPEPCEVVVYSVFIMYNN